MALFPQYFSNTTTHKHTSRNREHSNTKDSCQKYNSLGIPRHFSIWTSLTSQHECRKVHGRPQRFEILRVIRILWSQIIHEDGSKQHQPHTNQQRHIEDLSIVVNHTLHGIGRLDKSTRFENTQQSKRTKICQCWQVPTSRQFQKEWNRCSKINQGRGRERIADPAPEKALFMIFGRLCHNCQPSNVLNQKNGRSDTLPNMKDLLMVPVKIGLGRYDKCQKILAAYGAWTSEPSTKFIHCHQQKWK